MTETEMLKEPRIIVAKVGSSGGSTPVIDDNCPAGASRPFHKRGVWKVAESIAEQVIPYNCQATADTGTAVDAGATCPSPLTVRSSFGSKRPSG